MELSNHIIFFGALLVLGSILASVFSARFGTPILLIFLVLGMLAGEDGPGGIEFNDFQLAYLFSTLALAVIRRSAEQERGVALGAYTSFWDLGLGLAGLITGAVALAGYPWVFALAAALAASVAVGAALAPRATVASTPLSRS